jgi:hypothetical protein
MICGTRLMTVYLLAAGCYCRGRWNRGIALFDLSGFGISFANCLVLSSRTTASELRGFVLCVSSNRNMYRI